MVADDVSPAFILPEFSPRSGYNSAVSAAVHMPETAVNKDDFFVSGQGRYPDGRAGRCDAERNDNPFDGQGNELLFPAKEIFPPPGKCLHTKTYEPKMLS